MPITRSVCCKPAHFSTWWMDAAASWSRVLHPSLPQGPCVSPQPRESFHSGFIWHVFCSLDWAFLRILAARWSWGSANPSCVNSPKWRPFFLLKIRRRALSLSFPVALKLVGGLQGVRGPPLPPSPARPMPTLVGLISLIQTTRKQPGSEPCS